MWIKCRKCHKDYDIQISIQGGGIIISHDYQMPVINQDDVDDSLCWECACQECFENEWQSWSGEPGLKLCSACHAKALQADPEAGGWIDDLPPLLTEGQKQ